MDIYIKWNNDQSGVQLPILPASFEISDEMNNTSVMIHNLGEINLKGKRGLYSITIASFFPHEKYDFAKTDFHEPYEYYIAQLKARLEANDTLHLIITGTDINMYCTIESFTYGHEERNGDVKYSITLKEYRAIQSVSVAAGGAEVTRVTKSTSSSSYTWKKGDTWQKVTKKILGSSAKWKKVKQNNKAVIKKAKKKHPKEKEKDALVGYKVVVKA